jgi:hypothetical protein
MAVEASAIDGLRQKLRQKSVSLTASGKEGEVALGGGR